MLDVLSIASSGMRAAEMRLQAAAQNIANANTIGSVPNAVGAKQTREAYKPVAVTQSSDVSGGVRAEFNDSQSYVEAYRPNSPFADSRGIVAAPDVDLAKEAVDVVNAEVSFKANALVVRAAYQMFNSLMDAVDSDHDDRRRRYVLV